MVRDILQIGADVLTKETKVIKDINSPAIKELIQDLLDTCIDNKQGSAGLSAPQIGASERVCVCRRTDLEEELGEDKVPDEDLWEVMINPKITSESMTIGQAWGRSLSPLIHKRFQERLAKEGIKLGQ